MSSTKRETPKYRLIYFPFRGRAELVRMLLAHLQIPYQDKRIETAEWMNLKPGKEGMFTLILHVTELWSLIFNKLASLISSRAIVGGCTSIVFFFLSPGHGLYRFSFWCGSNS